MRLIIDAERTWQVGPVTFRYQRRSKDSPMGRFGGGWQWELGFQAGTLSRKRGTIIVNLLISSVRISWGHRR